MACLDTRCRYMGASLLDSTPLSILLHGPVAKPVNSCHSVLLISRPFMRSDAPTRIRWLLVAWVALVGAVSFLDRVNISIAARSITQEYRLSDLELGWIFAAFAVGYSLFQIPAGWTADRFGPRRVLAFGAVWWAVFTTLTACIPTGLARAVLIFWSVRFLLGMGECVMYPSSNRWVASWIPTAERGLANGLIFAGVGAGAAFTPPIVAAIMIHLGWRAAFWVCAALGLLVGLGWYALARDHPDQHAWVNEAERKWIREGLPTSGENQVARTSEVEVRGLRSRGAKELKVRVADLEGIGPRYSLSWRTILTSRDVWAITLSYFTYGYVAYIFFIWFYTYLTKVRGLDLKAGSYYGMLPFVAMSLGSATGGWIADAISRRFGRWWGRCGFAAMGLAGAAVFVAVGTHAESAGAASLILAGGAGSLYLSQSAYWALSADLGGPSSGSLSGFVNMGAQIGSAVTAVVTPVLARHFGWNAPFLAAATLCALGSAAWLIVNPNKTLAYDTRPRH